MIVRYEINIDSVQTLNRPFKASLGRVNVILGSNGTGKSKVLHSLKTNHVMFGNRSEIAYVEGGRTFTIPPSLEMNRNTIGYSTLDQASKSHQSKRINKLSDRITDALFALDRMGEAEYRKHSDSIETWVKTGQSGNAPRRSDPPLAQLSNIFQSVFPEIELTIDSGSKSITCKKNSSMPYPPSELSDGEKQVFCLIADILLLSKGNPLIVVDEPELNLHPSLAIDLWSLIESTLPEAVFVYATHSVAFALKHNVDSLIVLPRTGIDPIVVKDFSEINSEDLRSFLGAIPAILANPKAIAVEGEKDSIDSIIYKWIVGDPSIAIEAVGSCHNVISAVKRDGVWKTLGTPQKLVGIVDRDFRLDDYLKKIEEAGVSVLPFHEIESILLIPKIVSLLSERLGLVVPVTEELVKQKIIEKWNSEFRAIATKRTFSALKKDFSPSLPRAGVVAHSEVAQLEKAIVDCCLDEMKRLSFDIEDQKIKVMFQEILKQSEDALHTKNIQLILRLMPGKIMIPELLIMTGCKNIESAARAVAKHIKVEEIIELIPFKTSLRTQLGL